MKLNKYIYILRTKKYVYLYTAFKHTFLKIDRTEWDNLSKYPKLKDKLIKNKVLVKADYQKNFISHYKKQIGKPELTLMYVIPTDNCNFRCKYCFIEGNYFTKKRAIMKYPIAEKWINYFYDNIKTKEPMIIFYGGEPLLNKDVVIKSIKLIRKKDKEKKIETNVGINTNGSIYSEDIAKACKTNKVTLAISLDGNKIINDNMRIENHGKGTYSLVKRNIEKYHKKGVKITFSVTLNQHNINLIPQVAKHIIDNFSFIDNIGFNPPLDFLGNKTDIDYEKLMFNIYNAYRIFRNHGIYEDRIMRRIKPLLDEIPYLKDCAGCGNQIVVSPEGMIGPCHGFLGTKKDFQLKRDNFVLGKDKIFKKWAKLSPINNKDCYDCPYILICGNACPYSSFINTGSLKEPDKRMCKMLPIMFNELLKDNYYPKPKAIMIDFDDVILGIHVVKSINKTMITFGVKRFKLPKTFFNPIEYFKSYGLPKEASNLYSKFLHQDSKLNSSLIRQLRKINLPKYIVSSSSNKRIIPYLKKYKINSLFKDIFGSIVKKEENILALLKKLKLQPEDVVYIGDSFQNDIKPLYNIGVRAISFYANTADIIDNDWLIDLFKSYKNDKKVS